MLESPHPPEASPRKDYSLVKLGFLVLALIYSLSRIFSHHPDAWTHTIHLPIHEFGHLFFTPLGEFMHFLGGSLFQVIFPLVFTGSFLLRKDFFAAAITLLWIGDSLIDVSFYIADAYKQQMALIGGEHDWAVLLGMLDLTHHCETFGAVAHFFGSLTMLLGLLAGFFLVVIVDNQWIKIKF